MNVLALHQALEMVGKAFNVPGLSAIVNEVYSNLEEAEARGETRGFKEGYEQSEADAAFTEYCKTNDKHFETVLDIGTFPFETQNVDPALVEAARHFDPTIPLTHTAIVPYEGDSGDERP